MIGENVEFLLDLVDFLSPSVESDAESHRDERQDHRPDVSRGSC